jgi:hypothetical protein
MSQHRARALHDAEQNARDKAIGGVRTLAEAQGLTLGYPLGPADFPTLQKLYDGALATERLDPSRAISLGLALGAVFHETGRFEWVRLFDSSGDETALGVPGRQYYLSPISMIRKRLQAKERVSLAALHSEIMRAVEERFGPAA